MKNSIGIICILSLGLFLSNGRKGKAQTATFNYTGSVQTFYVPPCTTEITVQLWGAGGGGGNWNSNFGYDFGGGAGSYYTGVISPVYPGEAITLYVPGGGQYSNNTRGGAGGWTGGAQGGNDVTYGEEGGGGGGYAAIQIDTNYFVVVGGGGGGGSYPGAACYGGGGGANTGGTGGNGCCGGSGGGGSISAGGLAGNGANGCDPASAGTYLAGGQGGGTTCSGWYGGGGGGAGYYGGGGGSDYGGGGGGGSSYPSSVLSIGGITFTPSSNLQGGNGGYSVTTAPGSPPAGVGQGGYMGNGGDGAIIIAWTPTFVAVTDTVKIISNVTCNGINNGIATAEVTGGTPSTYTYSWAPSGQTSDTAMGLSAGSYTVTVSNTCGSTATASVTITQPGPFTVTGNIVNSVSCFGGNNGSASAILSGGTMPYTYSWTNGGTRDTASALSAGFYRAIITDNNGCSCSTTVSITQPTVLNANANVTSNASCGISSGSAVSTAGGGTMPYTYSWTGGGTNSSVSGLSGGTYMLNVTDNNGCTATSSVTITETPAVFASASTVSDVKCNGGNDGSAVSVVSGGAAPFTYAWSGGAGNNFTAAGLTAGTYTVNITDANGCSSSASVTVTEPTPITVITDTTVDIGACTGSAWVVPSGGVPPYTYNWSNGNTTFLISNQCKGHYCCIITDANGCVNHTCVTITSVAGVADIASNTAQITIYPNPNNGQFTIESSVQSGNSVVEIYNILGEKVYTTSLNTNKGSNTINVGSQPNGVYLYRIITESGSLLGEGKLIIQK